MTQSVFEHLQHFESNFPSRKSHVMKNEYFDTQRRQFEKSNNFVNYGTAFEHSRLQKKTEPTPIIPDINSFDGSVL